MTMRGREKLYFLLEAINDAREIAPSGQPLIIDPTNDLNRKYNDIELTQLFTKLEKDNQVLKVLKIPSRIKTIDIVEDIDIYGTTYDHDDGCWHIELLPAFDSYYLKVQHELEYQEFTGKKPPKEAVQEQKTELAIKIVDEFSPENYPFVLRVLEKIASLTEFSSDDKVDYQHQSPPGQLLIQERALLKKFESSEFFKHLGEDGIFGIATLSDVDVDLIRKVIARIKEKESGVISTEEFEEIKKQYSQSKPGKGYNKLFEGIEPKLQSQPIFLPQDTEKHEAKTSQGSVTQQSKSTNVIIEEVEWPDDFQWSDDHKLYLLGNEGKLTFGASDSKRKDVFKLIVENKGDWKTVGKIAQDISESESYIRTVINQLNSKIIAQGLQRYIRIQPRDQSNKPGAYRAVPFPTSIKHQ